MEPQPESQSRSNPLFVSGDRRNLSKLSTMSISELISELRDTFMRSDFNRVEETLISRDAMLKAEIEEKNLVIGLLQERIQFERLEKIRVELELKKVMGERGEKVVESEFGVGRSKVEVLKNRGVDIGAVVKVEGEKVGILGEKKRLNGESSKEGCLGSSDTERRSSPGEVHKNLATKLAKPIGVTPENDFNQVEETPVAKERMLKAEIEKKEEIGLLQEKNQYKRLERVGFDIQLKTVQAATHGEELVKNVGENGNGFGLDGSKVMKAELVREGCKPEGLKNIGVVNGNASAVAEQEGEKVEVLAKKKGLVGELIKKDGLGASGGRLGIGTAIDIENSDEDECNSQATSNRKATTSRVIADNDRKSFPRTGQTNLATPRMIESNGVLKRKFTSPRELVANINNVLDGLDSDVSSSSSSSSSSSGELDMDVPFRSLTSHKKMKTNATNL